MTGYKLSLPSLLICFIILLASFDFHGKSIYELKVRDINGGNLNPSKFQGKKIVFITVSGFESDSVLGHLSAFCIKFANEATFIAVLSYEDGFEESKKQAVKKRFRELKKLDIEITEGMYTKKGSPNQSELMTWLTRKEQNGHFNNDAAAGQKFFVDESGELYAVISSKIPLSKPIYEQILNRPKRL